MGNTLFNTKSTLFIVAALLLSLSAFAQDSDSAEHHHEGEMKPGLEAVISGLFIRDTEEEITDYGIELHLTYWATHKWAFGVGYTLVFEEESRIGHELAALISHKPFKFLTLNAGPSFTIPNDHSEFEVSAYLESEWAIQVGEFHVGPTVGILVGEHFRYFGGLHASYEF